MLLAKVFAIAGGDGILFGYYSLPSTLFSQSAFVPGLTFIECPAIANTEPLGAIEDFTLKVIFVAISLLSNPRTPNHRRRMQSPDTHK